MLIEILLELLYVLTYQLGRSLYVMLDKLPLCTPVLAVLPDLRNSKSAYSLTGRGLSSLFKKEHHETQRSRNQCLRIKVPASREAFEGSWVAVCHALGLSYGRLHVSFTRRGRSCIQSSLLTPPG